ncbi:EcsC family protein [Flavobacterium sp. DG1-102-2]|uniref:EcsC family protein n=1 Tax=Flavobacterium sp. DG1-102-2 TaxID=3081663 RepID=UPI002949446D|nr:EcsC family protein [Flavobacterium sp. DG1-102-2]MDV6168659.1 EcsC family protein [Flavobacterium sp. DG1-102-2]
MDLHQLIVKVMPSFNDVKQQVIKLKLENPGKPPAALSRLFINRARNKYASVGAVSALPGVIPGLGTAAQIALEAGAISADVALMLRWMAGICYGTGLIYGRDTQNSFEDEFTLVLGIWAEVIVPEKAALSKGEKITIGHFDQHITDRIKNKMNEKIARKLVTKYGSKRGGAVLGRLIPFGVGAVVGGTFNYMTLQKFGKAADGYFKTDTTNYVLPE